MFNLGSAGHDGFVQAAKCHNHIKELQYVKGGHGAGIQESRWDEISEFIVSGITPSKTSLSEPDFEKSRHPVALAIGSMSTAILIFLVMVIGTIGWMLFVPLVNLTGPVTVFLLYLIILRYLFYRF